MRKLFPTEFVFQAFSLLIAFIVVHTVYVAVIRPNADAFMAAEPLQRAANRSGGSRESFTIESGKAPNFATEREWMIPAIG